MLQQTKKEEKIKNWLSIQPIGNLEDLSSWPFNGYVSCIDIIGVIDTFLKNNDTLVGAEVGVCRGEGTAFMLQYCKRIKKMYAIDQWKEYNDGCGDSFFPQEIQDYMQTLFKINTEKFKDKIVVIQNDSVSASESINDNELDFVFIDADHSAEGVFRDMKYYYPKVKIGGLFAGHDWWHKPLSFSVLAFLYEKGYTSNDIFLFKDSCWGVIKK